MNWSPLNLPQIALESLSWSPGRESWPYGSEVTRAEVKRIAALTSLTKLDLSRVCRLAIVKPLQRMPLLKELSIPMRGGLKKDLIVPEALPSLEKLQITSDAPEWDCKELETWTLEDTTTANGKNIKTWTRPRF